ncbi:hypothetical protein CVV38_04340 [Candidatus Peregrinibacteria bacterium HGW-Peregrinibacteria-1]|jgi:hypothetical protein|nr:MAG: hypothetical protein CVV38_04340 [Candidatus Peregrinibacteria bacterium HGW-Peregrinibacteria-1]
MTILSPEDNDAQVQPDQEAKVNESTSPKIEGISDVIRGKLGSVLNGTSQNAESKEGSTLNQRITSLVQYFRRWSYSQGKVIMPDIIDIISNIINHKAVIDSFGQYEDYDRCQNLLEAEAVQFESTLKKNDNTIRKHLTSWGVTPKLNGIFLDARWLDSALHKAITKFNKPQSERDPRKPEDFRKAQFKALEETLSNDFEGDLTQIATGISDKSFTLEAISSQLLAHQSTPATTFILDNIPTKGFRKIPKREEFEGETYHIEKETKLKRNTGLTVVGPNDDPRQLPKGVLLDSNFGYNKDGSKRIPAHIMIIDDHEGFGQLVHDTATIQLLNIIKKTGLDSSYQNENGEYQALVKKLDADTILSSWIIKNLNHPLLQSSEFREILRKISICEDFKLGSTILAYGVKSRDYVYIIHGVLDQSIELVKTNKREKLKKEIEEEEQKVAQAGHSNSEKLEKLKEYLSWTNTTPLEKEDFELVLNIMHQALPSIITTPFAFDHILQTAYQSERETYDQISKGYEAGEFEIAGSMYDKDLLVISSASGTPLPEFKNRQGLYIFLRGQEHLNRELVLTKDGNSYDLATNAENMKSLLKYDFASLANMIKTAEQVHVSHLIMKKQSEITASSDPEKTKLLEYELEQLQRHFQLNKEGEVWRSRTQNMACAFSYLPEHDIMRIIVDWKKQSTKQKKKGDSKTSSKSSMPALGDLPAIEDRKLKVTKDDFNALFDNYSYTPENLVKLFEEDFGTDFDSDVQTAQFDTLRDHVLQVLHQYEVFFSYNNLPARITPKFMRLTLLLHDIGKPTAVKQGEKHLQHEKTLPILESTFEALGFSKEEIALASALVEEDPIGKYMLDKSSLDECLETIRKQAGKTSLELKDFYDLLMMFYMCDSSSYTAKPKPGKPSPLDKLYLLDDANRVISFAPAKEQKVDDLSAAIETYSRLDQISSVDSLEEYINANREQVEQHAQKITKGSFNQQMQQMKSLFAKNQQQANAIAWYVYNHMHDSMEDPNREPSLANIEKYLADDALMKKAVETVTNICAEENMDLQFNLMSLFFNSNPALYVATMKRMTFEISPALSNENTTTKIDKLLINYPGSSLYVAHQLADRLEKELIPKMLDTHATDLSGLLKMIASGGIKNAKEIGYRYVERKGDDFKLAGSLAVFTYLGAFFDDADIFINIDSDFLEEQYEKNPDSMCYYSEDFVVKPRRTANYRTAAQRASFREKFADVMKRPDAKHYLAYKIAHSILQEVIAHGIDIQNLSSAQLENWFIRYLENNSSGTLAPVSRLGGRPEGRLNLSVPLDKLKIRIPNYSIDQFILGLKKQKQEAEKTQNTDILKRIKYLTSILIGVVGFEPGLTLEDLEARITPEMKKTTLKDIIKEAVERSIASSEAEKAATMQAFLKDFDTRVQVYDAEMRKAPVKLYYKSVLQQSVDSDVRSFSNLRFLVVPKKNECEIIDPLQTESERQMFAYYLQQEHGIKPENLELKQDRIIIKNWDESLDLVKIKMSFIQMDKAGMQILRNKATTFFEELKLSNLEIAPEFESLKTIIDDTILRKLTDKISLIRDAMQSGNESKLNGVKIGFLQKKLGLNEEQTNMVLSLMTKQ